MTLAKDSHFEVKAAETSRARCWRLTWHAWPECPTWSKRAPTHDWMRYAIVSKSRESKRADKRLRALDRHRKGMSTGRFPVVDSATLEAEMSTFRSKPIVVSTTVDPTERRKPPLPFVEDSTAHVDWTMSNGSCGWWSSSTEGNLWAQIVLLFAATQKSTFASAHRISALPPMDRLPLQ